MTKHIAFVTSQIVLSPVFCRTFASGKLVSAAAFVFCCCGSFCLANFMRCTRKFCMNSVTRQCLHCTACVQKMFVFHCENRIQRLENKFRRCCGIEFHDRILLQFVVATHYKFHFKIWQQTRSWTQIVTKTHFSFCMVFTCLCISVFTRINIVCPTIVQFWYEAFLTIITSSCSCKARL